MNLGDIAQIFSGRAVKRAAAHDGGQVVRLVGLRDIGRRLAPVAELEEIEVAEGEDVGRTALTAGDVLVTSRGANVRAAVVQREHEGAIAGPNLIVVRLDGSLRPELVAAYLRHPLVSAQLLRDFVGSTTAGFTTDTLRRIDLRPAEDGSSALLADLVQRVDAYSEYQQRAIQLHQTAADEAVFEHLHADGAGARP